MTANPRRRFIQRTLSSSVAKYGVASILPRAASILGVFIITPFAIGRLGMVEYGYWALATSVTALVISPDLGVGNSIVNEFAALRAASTDRLSAQSDRIRSLVILLGTVALGWLTLGTIASAGYSFLLVAPPHASATFTAMGIGLICYLSAIPMAVAQKIQLANEVADRAVLWEGAGKVASVLLSLAVLALAPNIFLLIAAYMLPVTFAAWINGLMFMHQNGIRLRGDVSFRASLIANRRTLALGKWFVVIQVSYLALTSSDLYLLNAVLGPAAVSEASVLKRPFDVLPVVISMYGVALWPVYRRMMMHGEHRRLSRAFTLGAIFTAAGCLIGGGVLIAIAPWLFPLLSAGTVAPGVIVLLSIAALATSTGVVIIFTAFLNAAGVVRIQAYIFAAGSVLSLASKILGLSLYGITGFFLFSAMSYLVFICVPLLVLCILSLRSWRTDRTPAFGD